MKTSAVCYLKVSRVLTTTDKILFGISSYLSIHSMLVLSKLDQEMIIVAFEIQ